MKKVAIITGAGRGIGKATAHAFAHKKYHVVVAEINPDLGQQTADEINQATGQATFIKTDVSSVSDIENMVRLVVEEFGRIDVLVNNAGVSEFFDPLVMTEETWDRILGINLKAQFFLSREVATYMKQAGGGSIVNIASTRAIMSEPNSEAYAASKGGILALTYALAASFSKYNITVNAVLPGWIETGDYASLREEDHRQHLSGRVGKPEDIARACLFLTKRKNNFITGTHLIVDGGMTRKMIYVE